MRPLLPLAVLIGAFLAPALLAQPPEGENRIESQNTARVIVERAVKAHGGDVRVTRARMTRVRLRAVAFLPQDEVGTAPFDLEIITQLPDKYRSVMTVSYQGFIITRALIINGEQGWETLNIQGMGGQGRELKAKEIKEAKEQIYAETITRLLTLRETGYELRALDEIKDSNLDHRILQGVNVVKQGHRDVNLYFDKKTGLLMKMEHVVCDPQAKESSQEVYFLDHRSTNNGPKHWGWIVVLNDHNRIFQGERAEVQFPTRLDARLFQKPPEMNQKKETKSEKDRDKEKKPEKK